MASITEKSRRQKNSELIAKLAISSLLIGGVLNQKWSDNAIKYIFLMGAAGIGYNAIMERVEYRKYKGN